MRFEKGHTYTLTRNKDFTPSRESGRLCFQVDDSASAQPINIKAFDFQLNNIPEQITCRYMVDERGRGKLEQDKATAVAPYYTPGTERQMRVLAVQGGRYTLSDDAFNICWAGVDLGKAKIERWKTIQCRIEGFDDRGQLLAHYLPPKAKARVPFNLDTIIRAEGIKLLSSRGIIDRILALPLLAEAQTLRHAGDPAWVLEAVDVVRQYMAGWLSEHPSLRRPWLQALRQLAVALIERSTFLAEFGNDERMTRQQQLAAFVADCDDYLEAAQLLASGQGRDFITSTLTSMRQTGWLYDPERKMRLLMALFSLRSSLSAEYIEEILSLVLIRHREKAFMDAFGPGILVMLGIYIDNESKYIDGRNRQALRNLIEAIAMQLLLTRDLDRDLPSWALHRGIMYSCAHLIVERPDSPLPRKAFTTLAGQDTPLEYRWDDLDDINRLCHVALSNGPEDTEASSDASAIYEGDGATLRLSDQGVHITPSETGPMLVEGWSQPLWPGTDVAIHLNVKAQSLPSQEGRSRHALDWMALIDALAMPPKEEKKAKAADNKPQEPRLPVKGEKVDIRIFVQRPDGQEEYPCEVVQEGYKGYGTIAFRDIVAYPVNLQADSFKGPNGNMLMLNATCIHDGDTGLRFSLKRQTNDLMNSYASEDYDTKADVKGVITASSIDRGGKPLIMCVSDYGYPFILDYDDFTATLGVGELVTVAIHNVNYKPEADRLFINAHLLHTGAEIKDAYVKRDPVPYWFNDLLNNLCGEREYVKPQSKAEAEEEEAVEESVADENVTYLSTPAVAEMSRLLDIMAQVNRPNPSLSYDQLALARLLARISGNTWRERRMEVKMRLAEALEAFARDGRLDPGTLAELTQQASEYTRLRDPDVKERLFTLRLLSLLDAPDTPDIPSELIDKAPNAHLENLRRLVNAYNMLRGLQLSDQRQEILQRIYRLLNLQLPKRDLTRVNAREDHYNEFKTSLFYPAGNQMKASPDQQGLAIIQGVCAFLNADGGTLYLGVGNLGQVTGLDNDFIFLNKGFDQYDIDDIKDKYLLAFGDLMRRHIGPTYEGRQMCPGYVNLDFDQVNNRWIGRITVKPFPGAVTLGPEKELWIRGSNNKDRIRTSAERQAYMRRRQQPTGATKR